MKGQFDKMVEDLGFRVIDASRSIDEVFADLKQEMSAVLTNGQIASGEPIGRLNPDPIEQMTQVSLRAAS